MITQNQGDKQFEELLGIYLKQRQTGKNSNVNQPHVDEDRFSAFVEGSLNEQQAAPIIKHLIDCSFCRRVAVQLAELTESFGEIQLKSNAVKSNNWRRLWGKLTESVIRPLDNVIVAHEAENEPDEEQESESSKK